MAENGTKGPLTPMTASAEPKKRPNILKKNAARLKSRISRSPKRRAGTPEPEQKVFTDESEKDTSDGENLFKPEESVALGEVDPKGRQNAGIRRFITRRDTRHRGGRSKSLERTLVRETESEDDFETIRKMHKSKEMEEEKQEVAKFIESSKSKSKEDLKEYVQKDMPPLILAPKDAKRRRHKSLPLQDFSSEGETPVLKPRQRSARSKPLTSEDDERHCSRKGTPEIELENHEKNLRKRVLSNEEEKCEAESTADDHKKNSSNSQRESSTIPEKKPWFFSRLFSKNNKSDKEGMKQKVKELMTAEVLEEEKHREKSKEMPKQGWLLTEIFREWNVYVKEHRDYINRCQKLKNRCITDLIILLFFCGCGGLIFRFTEGAFESFYKCGVKRVKRDFIDTLWKYSQYMLEEDWKSHARRRLMEFENQLHSAHEAGMTTYSGQKSWSFLNAVVYCLTVVTTIGYGHISPSTTTGRAITIIYAIFGIPMFLILLADFGKLFTRGIKFIWAFVRRLYYTGSCRKVRKTAPVQEVMKGVQIMYDFAKTRKFSNAGMEKQDTHLRPPDNVNLQGLPETPSTPNWSTFEIDDEFNLPISVAIAILLIYIFFGAFLYWMWEDWSFFESFYFVFISMSTIGFGDFVPQHPIYMMLSIVYLIFGLALTSMCINVVQEKLSDTFKQASAKLGTTIGLSVDEPSVAPPNALNVEPNQVESNN